MTFLIDHEAEPSDDPFYCVTCRQPVFWVVKDGQRVYHHVADLQPNMTRRLHSALKLIYPMKVPNTLRRGELYERVVDHGIKITSLEFLRWLDALEEVGLVKITRSDGKADTIEVAR